MQHGTVHQIALGRYENTVCFFQRMHNKRAVKRHEPPVLFHAAMPPYDQPAVIPSKQDGKVNHRIWEVADHKVAVLCPFFNIEQKPG